MRDTSLVVKQPFAKDVYISAKSASYRIHTYICKAVQNKASTSAACDHDYVRVYMCVVCDYLYPLPFDNLQWTNQPTLIDEGVGATPRIENINNDCPILMPVHAELSFLLASRLDFYSIIHPSLMWLTGSYTYTTNISCLSLLPVNPPPTSALEASD